MPANTPQKLQDEIVALLAPDLDPTAVALATAWLNVIKNGGITVRGVGTVNHSLTAFTVATSTDGVTFVQGDLVLLCAQTTAADNGIYRVGAVATTAPLTRYELLPTGSTLPGGLTINVGGEGTVFKNTVWASFAASQNVVVGTTDPKFYPRSVSWTSANVAGVNTCGVSATSGAPAVMPIFSAKSYIIGIPGAVIGGTPAIAGYRMLAAPTPGVCGVGTATITACVDAGSISVADVSTMFCTLINQP